MAVAAVVRKANGQNALAARNNAVLNSGPYGFHQEDDILDGQRRSLHDASGTGNIVKDFAA